jgi:hypothetical protein
VKRKRLSDKGFTAVDGDGTTQESQMIDLFCAWCDVDARVFL